MVDKWASPVNRLCLTCRSTFMVQYQSAIRSGGGCYCSKACNPHFKEAAKSMIALEIGAKRALVDVNCKGCGRSFQTRVKNIVRGGGRYCSRACNPAYAKRFQPSEKYRRYNLSRNYGLSVAEFERMRSTQQGRCAICRSLPDYPHGVHVVDRAYLESDVPNPQSEYGRSKLFGEQEALTRGVGAAIVRTSWVCGRNGANMVKTVMRLAKDHAQLSFVCDQVGNPTFTQDLAPVLRTIAHDRLSGIIHATNQESCSWHQFAQAVVAAMGKDPAMVLPITTAELQPPRPAPRPANSVLDNTVLRAAGYPPMRNFHEPLAETVAYLL